MPDDRTDEQKQADDQLTQALENACRAYGHLEEGWSLGDYVICIEYVGFLDHTIGQEKYGYVLPRDFMPGHRLIGLLRKTLIDVETEQ